MTRTMLPDLTAVDLDKRRQDVAARNDLQAIDYLEVRTAPPADNQRVLELHFVAKASAAGTAALIAYVDALVAQPTAIRVRGGEVRRHIKVLSATRSGEVLVVRVDAPGDFSTYTLTLSDPAGPLASHLDPVFSGIAFSFKAGCPTRFDCRGECRCDDPELPEPYIDYLAKDYRSFRQALLDRLPTLVPDWLERREADLGMTLVELLAYAGDQLSYQQDAVLNEAYLQTVRQRLSARRHARLLDYRVDEGASARAFVVADVSGECTIHAGAQLLTELQAPFGALVPPLPAVLDPVRPEDAELARAASVVFETPVDAHLHPDLNAMAIHAWDLGEVCLPTGSTTIDVDGDLAYVAAVHGNAQYWRLRPGRLVVLEEVVGAVTGLPADADPVHRQVVRLTSAAAVTDPVLPGPVTRLTWSEADALMFPLCVNRRDNNGVIQPVAVVHGNVLVADHGQSRTEYWPQDPSWPPATPPPVPPKGMHRGERPVRFLLDEGPLSAWRPIGEQEPVAGMLARRAILQVGLDVERTPTDTLHFDIADDLISARAFDTQFVAEVMNDGRATVRFGDGVHGRAPAEGSFVKASYRVGRGRAGNVGAGALRHLLRPFPLVGLHPPIQRLRNPLPASGGTDPETIDQIKVRAPVAFRSPQLRAVTEADYAEVAMRHEGVAGAVARFRWTGSWLTIYLTIDAKDRERLDAGLAEDVKAFVAQFTQAGYDLEVRPPAYVALDLELFICVAPDRFRADVEHAVREALSSWRLAHGRLGFFHPDRRGFGQPLYLSALYAAVAAVPGVDSVTARRFSRYHDEDPLPGRPLTAANIDAGRIAVGELEVIELAGDPSLPERGVLTITAGGGR